MKMTDEHKRKISESLKKGDYFHCLVCKEEFWRKPKDIKKGNNKFCSKKCYFVWQRGRPRTKPIRQTCHGRLSKQGTRWKSAIYIINGGYITVKYKDHPRSNGNGYVLLHVLIMEHKIGRFLKWKGTRGSANSEVVHHINSDVTDNRLENLQLMTRSEHTELHDNQRNAKKNNNKK